MSNVRPVVSPAVYSGPLGHIVGILSPHSEGDPVGILSALLGGFSALVGGTPTVKVGNRAQSLLFWPVLVGNTSTGRKGTATGDALSVITTAFPDFMERHSIGEPQSGPALIADMAGKAGAASGYPFLMVSEEFAQLLDASKRFKTLGKCVREAWQGNTLTNVTKTDGEIKVMNSHMAVIGNITPKEFTATIGRADKAGGTMNRFFPVYVAQSKELPLGGNLSRSERALMAQLLHGAVMHSREVDEIGLSREAERAWVNRFYSEIRTLTTGSEDIEQFAGRAHPYALRIAGLYALADCRDEINVTDLESAVALVSYMAETVTFISPQATNEASVAAQVESFIRQAGEAGVRVTEIYRRFGMKRADLEGIVAGLDTIEITKITATGGRPAMVYRYVMPSDEITGGSIGQDDESEETAVREISEETSDRESADVPEPRPEELEALKAVMYGTKPEPMPERKSAAPDVPSAVRDLMAKLEAVNTPAVPEPSPVSAVDALKAMLTGQPTEPVPVQQTLTLVESDDEDDDLSDLLASCAWAKVA